MLAERASCQLTTAVFGLGSPEAGPRRRPRVNLGRSPFQDVLGQHAVHAVHVVATPELLLERLRLAAQPQAQLRVGVEEAGRLEREAGDRRVGDAQIDAPLPGHALAVDQDQPLGREHPEVAHELVDALDRLALDQDRGELLLQPVGVDLAGVAA